ncbi:MULTISPECIES: proton-conducting transporter membrane subunit [unclassified Photobacterium]|uniref:proton-conducting transporter transmembrane domain-containing protein n=1 Tax=unclassified Photobacterium TaxID=2628852 RepID=UPI001EDCD020|nr:MULTISPECIES: proton-conducting transporter membrane subunit [unclassified Photobacterium]MCG3865209.1 hydrogenase 4 subunit B [Photobacterium sp. Ph6]MCG3876708.1 hydrogenase 4 subunit B [Photobacterium sp. Ph5]
MNPLVLVLFAVISYGVAALISWLGRKDERDSLRLAGVISAFGGVFGVLAGVSTIVGHYDSADFAQATRCVVNMDMLSALMVVVISIVTMAASIYSINYLKEYLGKSGWKINILFNIFAAAMTVLVISANVITFMVFMEVVSIASWLIVISDGSLASRKAGLNYFIVDHIASFLIMAAFLILSINAHSYDFSAFTTTPLSAGFASLTFLLALVGFGIKSAGVGLHGWLIKAYPISPSYCSTLISCVMVKIGIYGILKFSIIFLGATQLWWGFLVLIFGAVSSVLGVMYALAEHDIKRLLAYHTIENIGIILIGVGVSMIGIASHHPVLALLGLLGGLYHLLNHAIFKGLLCLGSGSIVYRMHTKDMDKMGGLGKTMPKTAIAFLIGTLAICALPPFNGFVSEWFIYQSLFSMGKVGTAANMLFGPFGMVMLALTGALACMCFVKVYGICFTGAPKTEQAANTREVGAGMTTATTMLAILCIVLGVGSPWIAPYFSDIASSILHLGPVSVATGSAVYPAVADQAILSTPVIAIMLALLALVPAVLLYVFRQRRLVRRQQGDPWACGYQYEQRMTVSAEGITRPMRHMFSLIYDNRPKQSLIDRHVLPHLFAVADGSQLDGRKVCIMCCAAALFVVLFFPFISGVSC